MNLSPEERKVGKENFYAAVGGSPDITRREFIKGTIAAGVVSGAGLGGMYYKYTKVDNPVRIGVIGTGDEGSVLINAITPSYIEVKAIADIRPYNVHRAFHGDHSSDNALKNRCGLMTKYDWKTEDEAKDHVKVFGDYRDLLAAKEQLGIEAVIIALPLHLHAPAAIAAMQAGLHVLTEKLMGYSVAACKEMGRVSQQTDRILATGHQRHYSVLYDNAVDCIRQNIIGDVHSIRAQWHRQADTWSPPVPGIKQSDDDLAKKIKDTEAKLKEAPPTKIDGLQKLLVQLNKQLEDKNVDAAKFGFQSKTLENGDVVEPLEELIRWRLWQRTGGGLMAELGSHQLDASGIFVSALDHNHEKALPLSVQAVGGRYLLPPHRECEDHVYCMYEFPKPDYWADKAKTQVKDPSKKLIVTYSSINGNGFGDYGECVMGTKGTLVLLKEQDVMLYKEGDTKTNITVGKAKDGSPVLDTTESGSAAAAVGKLALESGPPSKGYTEEIEHWAWCIRNRDPANLPKCHPKVALGDAVIALTTNIAVRNPAQSRIEFNREWFDIASDETPEGEKPDLSRYS
jgi:predicted dehydrogenase